MDIPVIKIGNSKGIRLSKTILRKYEIRDEVELILEDGFIILKPKVVPRKGWEDAYEQMHAQGENELLIPDVFEDENFEE